MAKWRAEAIKRMPELREEIASAENVMALWIELLTTFEFARNKPEKEDLILRIRSYAKWCLNAPRDSDPSHDPPTAVTVAFYEHLDDLDKR